MKALIQIELSYPQDEQHNKLLCILKDINSGLI